MLYAKSIKLDVVFIYSVLIAPKLFVVIQF